MSPAHAGMDSGAGAPGNGSITSLIGRSRWSQEAPSPRSPNGCGPRGVEGVDRALVGRVAMMPEAAVAVEDGTALFEAQVCSKSVEIDSALVSESYTSLIHRSK